MSHKSRRAFSRARRRETGALSRNDRHNLAQTNLAGQNQEELDTKAFGDNYPTEPGPNCSIISFQNTGQMNRYTTQPKSIQIAKAFKISNVSVSLYAEHSLNESESKFHFSNSFHQRMLNINPKSLLKLSHNTHRNLDTPWRYPGGTALTMNATAKAHMTSTGNDSTGLGRWTWTHLEGRYKTFSTCISAYRPCTNKEGLSTTWNQHVRYFRDQGIAEPHP